MQEVDDINMPWKYNNRLINIGSSWTNDDGIKHPSNWNIWSDADKKANGLVWENEPEVSTPARNLNTLKAEWKETINQEANQKLQPTDWMVIRLQEDSSKSLSSEISTYRAAVRTAANNIETSINNCTTLDEFDALWVESGGNKAPIENWPDEI